MMIAKLSMRCHVKALFFLIAFICSALFLKFYAATHDLSFGRSRFSLIEKHGIKSLLLAIKSSHGLEHGNTTCKFPVLDPWDKTIRKYIKHPGPLVCREVQPELTFIDDSGFVHLNKAEVDRFNKTGCLLCRLRSVDRATGRDDDGIIRGDWNELTCGLEHNFPHFDTVEVVCSESGSDVYYNLHNHPRILPKKPLKSTEDQLSVYLLILDSVSHSLAKRNLPKTYEYLTEEMDLRIFNGFTKVGDNTFPNLMPVITGRRGVTEQLDMMSEMPPALRDQVDAWPLIWKNFGAKGYSTAFIEDRPSIGIFHHYLKGFAQKPVDHYMRPYFLARHASKLNSISSTFCFGSKPHYESQLDFALRLLRQYKTRRSFIFNVMVDLTHSSCCALESADLLFLNFFQKIYNESLLNETMMIVMSDHGHRFSELRSTLVGLVEERMPFYGIYFPPWFYKKHPEIDRSIRINQWRLSSHFDVHQTLLDVLQSRFTLKQLNQETRGLSQLYEIHSDRTCTEAGIPEKYCVCDNQHTVRVDEPLVQRAAAFVVNSTNGYLQDQTKCKTLRLSTVERAEMSEQTVYKAKNVNFGFKIKQKWTVKLIRVLVSAQPSGALFEGLVHFDVETDRMSLPNDVSRVNAYGNQDCIQDAWLRKYCICEENS